MTKRKYEGRCHLCQFVKKEPAFGEMIENDILFERKSAYEIARFMNSHEYISTIIPENITAKKVYTHRNNHMPDRNEVMSNAKLRVMAGDISLEHMMAESLATMMTLKEKGMQKIIKGEITPQTIHDFFKILEIEKSMLGAQMDRVQHGIQGGGVAMPMDIMMEMIETMQEFVSVHDRARFRAALDEKVFPKMQDFVDKQNMEYESEFENDEDEVLLLDAVVDEEE